MAGVNSTPKQPPAIRGDVLINLAFGGTQACASFRRCLGHLSKPFHILCDSLDLIITGFYEQYSHCDKTRQDSARAF